MATRSGGGMIEAVVQTGSFETPYRRDGSGAPILLLGEDENGTDEQALFAALAVSFRVLAPLMPRGAYAARGGLPDAWLRGLIDGLGIERPAVVGGPSHGLWLLRYAEADPDRVGRLAVVGPEHASWPDATLADAAAAALHPVLLVPLRVPGRLTSPDAGLQRLVDFLARPMAG
jgi:pimeloyl-ACP methyl ester carboxylesterase